jgi:hypothetical protein
MKYLLITVLVFTTLGVSLDVFAEQKIVFVCESYSTSSTIHKYIYK